MDMIKLDYKETKKAINTGFEVEGKITIYTEKIKKVALHIIDDLSTFEDFEGIDDLIEELDEAFVNNLIHSEHKWTIIEYYFDPFDDCISYEAASIKFRDDLIQMLRYY